MIKEELEYLFPFVCDECGKMTEDDNGSPLDFLCYTCLEDGLPK
jgi:hypothetical protein